MTFRASGVLIGTVTTPPWTVNWDTTTEPEANWSVTAEAHHAGAIVTSAPVIVVVDRQPPTLLSRSPAPLEENVSVRRDIVATFSEPIRPDTVTATSVTVDLDNVAVPKTMALSSDGTTLSMTLASKPRAPSNAAVVVATTILDRAGNAFVAPADAWVWAYPYWWRICDLAACRVSADAMVPAVDIDRGEPIIAFPERTANPMDLRTTRWDETGWNDLGTSQSAVAGNTWAAEATLVAGTQGAPWDAWMEDDGAGSVDVHVSNWSGTAWSPAGSALGTYIGATAAGEPALALDATEKPWVAFDSPNATGEGLISVAHWSGTDWSFLGTPFRTGSGSASASSPQLVRDSSGYPVVAWTEANPVVFDGWTSIWNGASWVPLGGIHSAYSGSTDVVNVRLAVDTAGHPFIGWVEFNGTNANLLVTEEWTGSAWVPAASQLSVNGAIASTALSLGVDRSGHPILAYTDLTSGTYDLHVQRWTGSAWVPLGSTLSGAPNATDVESASLRLDTAGDPVVTWMELDRLNTRSIYAARYNK